MRVSLDMMPSANSVAIQTICLSCLLDFDSLKNKILGRVTGLLNYKTLLSNWQSGDISAGNDLFADLQRELQGIARAKLAQEHSSSLSTGDLINEAVIRLSALKQMEFESKSHILSLAARIMRQILIDQARKKNSDKRQHQKVTLLTNVGVWDQPIELLSLELVLEELQDIDPQRADIVEMRFYGGMTIADIAIVLEMSEATVKRRWSSTRAWLQNRLSE